MRDINGNFTRKCSLIAKRRVAAPTNKEERVSDACEEGGVAHFSVREKDAG